MDLYEPYNIDVIFRKIFEEGVKAGEEQGKQNMINSFKKLLQIEEQ